jgi:hypothetical protein
MLLDLSNLVLPANAVYCNNCFNLPVCKFKDKLAEIEAIQKKFNDVNVPNPTRISITNVNFNCRHKDTTGPT